MKQKKRSISKTPKTTMGIALISVLLVSSLSLGNVEAKSGDKSGACVRYCKSDNVELWKRPHGKNEDEPILYMKKNDLLTYYPNYIQNDPSIAYVYHVSWGRNGYMDSKYLSKKKI